MDLKDATLVFVIESAGCPAVAELAQAAYARLADGQEVEHRFLSGLLGEASGKGVLRAIRRKYSPAAFDAILMPICREIDRQRPVPPRRRPPGHQPGPDPLTAPISLII
jgi:hypothetical protein